MCSAFLICFCLHIIDSKSALFFWPAFTQTMKVSLVGTQSPANGRPIALVINHATCLFLQIGLIGLMVTLAESFQERKLDVRHRQIHANHQPMIFMFENLVIVALLSHSLLLTYYLCLQPALIDKNSTYCSVELLLTLHTSHIPSDELTCWLSKEFPGACNWLSFFSCMSIPLLLIGRFSFPSVFNNIFCLHMVERRTFITLMFLMRQTLSKSEAL